MFTLMRRLFMLPFQLLPIILVVGALGLFIRTQSIDPAPFARQVADAVRAEVGQQMEINGGVELEFAWPPRLVMRDVRIRNPRWAGGENMLRVERIEAELDPLDLLFGEVNAPTTRFVNAEIIVARAGDGTGNWGPNAADGPGAVLARAFANLGSERTELAGGRILLQDGDSGSFTVVPLGGTTVVTGVMQAARPGTRGDDGRRTADGHPCETRG